MSKTITSVCVYEDQSETFEGCLAYDKETTSSRPGILLAPNWMGVTSDAIEQAKTIAAEGYVVLVADLYGQHKRPASTDEAGEMLLAVKDKPIQVSRMQAALAALINQTEAAVSPDKIAAIGFSFGGHCALELARSGADIKAAVSFYSVLDTQGQFEEQTMTSAVLVLDGAADPIVPRDQLSAFASEMTSRAVDWQLISFAGALHSFTEPSAQIEGVAKYNPEVSERAFGYMYQLFSTVFK